LPDREESLPAKNAQQRGPVGAYPGAQGGKDYFKELQAQLGGLGLEGFILLLSSQVEISQCFLEGLTEDKQHYSGGQDIRYNERQYGHWKASYALTPKKFTV